MPTSQATADLATKEGITLLPRDDHRKIDVAIDGADQVDFRLNQIPGVIENGLFVGRTDVLIVATPDGVEITNRPSKMK
ncbi:MAG: ribose-5-phosphate isomerase A [Elusimicrobiota bacterium]